MTVALEGGEWSAATLYPWERPGTRCAGGWVGPRAVWTGGKSRPHWDSILNHPARSSVAIPTESPGPLFGYHTLHECIVGRPCLSVCQSP
jgi:hypothetical protein